MEPIEEHLVDYGAIHRITGASRLLAAINHREVSMRRIILALSALLVLAFFAPKPAMAQSAQSWIRVMHDSPDAPNVDLFVDSNLVIENVGYSAISNYQAIASGQHRVQVAPAGEGIEASVIDINVDLTRNKPYTVLGLGKLANIKGQLLPDTSQKPPEGNARVRIIHAATDFGTVDIYPSGSTIPVLTDQYFGSADYINIPAGTYSFNATPAGSSEVVLTSQQLKFEPGWVYSLVLYQPDTEATPLVHASVDRLGSGEVAQAQP